MENIAKKVAYLKGLFDGMNFDTASNEGKLFSAIIDVLDDIAIEMEDMVDQLDTVDQDLGDLEEYVYEEDDYCDGDCEGCDGCDGYDFEEDELYEIECPACHHIVPVDLELVEEDGAFTCPDCDTMIDIDILCEDEEED